MEKNNQKTQKEMTRNERIEAFMFDKERATFESIEMFEESVSELLDLLSAINVDSLEMIQGKDGVTPVYGQDYMTEEDLQKIQEFIISKIPKLGVDLPTTQQVKGFIEDAVAKIPHITGPAGKDGQKGADGKDGSADTGADIIAKIRTVKKNQMLKVGDIRGLQKVLAGLVESSNSIEDLKRKVDNFVQIIPTQNVDGSGSSLNIVYSDTEPTDPADGDLWVDTSVRFDLPVTSADASNIVVLSQAEYDALGSYDSETLYHITA